MYTDKQPITHEELTNLAHPRSPVVRRDEKRNFEFHNAVHNTWTYWIPEEDISRGNDLLAFIHHLTGKNWITTQHIRELIHLTMSKK